MESLIFAITSPRKKVSVVKEGKEREGELWRRSHFSLHWGGIEKKKRGGGKREKVSDYWFSSPPTVDGDKERKKERGRSFLPYFSIFPSL